MGIVKLAEEAAPGMPRLKFVLSESLNSRHHCQGDQQGIIVHFCGGWKQWRSAWRENFRVCTCTKQQHYIQYKFHLTTLKSSTLHSGGHCLQRGNG